MSRMFHDKKGMSAGDLADEVERMRSTPEFDSSQINNLGYFGGSSPLFDGSRKMKKLVFFFLIAFVVSASLHLCSCARSDSWVGTVTVPVTEQKNQGSANICWAYATNGLLESLAMSRNQRETKLSEGYLFALRMAKGMSADLEVVFGTESKEIAMLKLKRTLLLPNGAYRYQTSKVMDESSRPWNANRIVDEYGFLEEVDFPTVNVERDSTLREYVSEVYSKLFKLMEAAHAAPSESEILSSVLSDTRLFPVNISPELVGKARDNMRSFGVRMDDFVSFQTQGSEDYDMLVELIKLSIKERIPVPISLVSDDELMNGTTWEGPSYGNLVGAGHASLVIDFVNQGGREGGLDERSLAAEMEKHPRMLNYVVLKNSWGMSHGYYRATKEYLLKNTYSYHRGVTIVIHRKILEKAMALRG